ncbi:MAG: hypothetical protein PGN09_07710 [Sphingomonas fennica]
MSRKAITGIAIGAVIIGAAVATGGISLAPSVAAVGSTSVAVGGAAFTVAGAAAAGGLVTTTLGAMALSIGASFAITSASTALTSGPKQPTAAVTRLNTSIDPRASRKTVLGSTAMPADVRYQEYFGAEQEWCGQVVAAASHKIGGVDEIWLNDELAWTAAGGTQGKFATFFFVEVIPEAGPGKTHIDNYPGASWSGRWDTSCRLTGCATVYLKYRLTGYGKKGTSPFSQQVPSRITIIGRGGMLYDPRRDGTAGGSGAMRAADQSTWAFTAGGDEIGSNLPLQILRVLLGWRINGKLAVGSGLPVRRIHLASFAEAANLADEMVTIAGGGTERRFHGALVYGEDEAPRAVLDVMLAACSARLVEIGGKIGIKIAHNDLALAATDPGLNTDDVMGAFTWNPDPALDQTPNVIRGRYTDPSSASLYQMIDYAEVRLDSPDGIDRTMPFDLAPVESPSHAERVASQALQRRQYQRTFTAPFDIRAHAYTIGQVVPFTFAPLGFNRRLFRLIDREPAGPGVLNLTLREENAAVYAWDGGNGAPVRPADPIVYDTRNNPIIVAIEQAGETADWVQIASSDPSRPKPQDGADVTGENTAKDTANVAGRPAKDLVEGFDKYRVDIDDLQDVFGTTESAEVAKAASEAAAAAAAASARGAQASSDSSSGSALAAAGSAGAASASAAAASRQATLAAIVGAGSLNPNPYFSNWPDGELPTSWVWWDASGGIVRSAGINGRPYAASFTTTDANNSGISTDVQAAFGKWVIEVTVQATGTWRGSGILYYGLTPDGGSILQAATIAFGTTPDTAGWVPGVIEDTGGGTYVRTFSLYVENPIRGDLRLHRLYAMANWDGFGQGRGAKAITFHQYRIRPASAQEIEARKALGDAGRAIARITDLEEAVAASDSAYASRFSQVEAIIPRGSNLVRNTEWPADRTEGWAAFQPNGSTSVMVNGAGDPWHPLNKNVLSIYQTGEDSAASWYQDAVPLEPGQWYQVSARVAAHRAAVKLVGWSANADGTGKVVVADSGAIRVGTGGQDIRNFTPMWLNFQAPGARGQIEVYKQPTDAGQGDSWMWICNPQIVKIGGPGTPYIEYTPGPDRGLLDGAFGRLTTTEIAAARADGRSQAYFQKVAEVPGGRASLTLYATRDNGEVRTGVDIDGDVRITGNTQVIGIVRANAFVNDQGVNLGAIVPGSLNFKAAGYETISVAAGAFNSTSGAYDAGEWSRAFAITSILPITSHVVEVRAGYAADIPPGFTAIFERRVLRFANGGVDLIQAESNTTYPFDDFSPPAGSVQYGIQVRIIYSNVSSVNVTGSVQTTADFYK